MQMDDQREFLKLLLNHQNDLKSFVSGFVRDRNACDDVIQETVLVAWEKFAEFEPDRSFGAWLRGIAARKIMQSRGQLGRLPIPFSPEAVQAVLDAFDRASPSKSDRAEALETCVGQLPERSSRLVKLRYDESLTMAEIAERVGSTMEAVQRSLSRIRAKLLDCVERRLATAKEISR